jgi:hypothetical protein
MFNGGFLWGREPRMMRNCIIIVGWTSGSVIVHTQNNGFNFIFSHLFLLKTILTINNTIINSIISISATHASKAKANLDVVNNNSCAL